MRWQVQQLAAAEDSLRTKWTKHLGVLRPLFLCQRPVQWADATIGVSDTSRLFRYKLFLIHRNDTAVYTTDELLAFRQYWQSLKIASPFSAADLKGMRLAYEQGYPANWPASLGPLRVIKTSKPRRRYIEYTPPLFSTNRQWALQWQHLHSGSDGDSEALWLYKRTSATTWRLAKQVTATSISYDYIR